MAKWLRRFAIAIASVALFFPLYLVLAAILPKMHAAIASAVFLYLGFPILLLRFWLGEWSHTKKQTADIIVWVISFAAFSWLLVGVLGLTQSVAEKILAALTLGYGAVYRWLTGRGLMEPTR